MTTTARTKSLRVESLESRQMMAGDVNAFAINRILYINGDVAANGIALVDGGNGDFNLVGLIQGGSATTINGSANSQVFTKIRDVVITMGKGDDAVAVSGITIKGNLYLAVSQGNDAIGLGDFADTGLFDNAVDALLGSLTVQKSMIVSADDGNDTVLARALAVEKSFILTTGEGDDTVSFDTNGVAGVSSLKGVTVSTAGGADTVSLNAMTVAKGLTVETGTENDEVTISNTTAKDVTVVLSTGDDEVIVDDLTVTKTGTFKGGPGINTYTDLGGNTFGKLKRDNFQNVI